MIKQLTRNKFVRNVIIVASGTAGAQAITMLFSPIITRMYGPEAFGVMGTFSAMTNIIIPVAALTYPIAIVLPKRHEEAKVIMKLSMLVALILSSLSLIAIMFFKADISSLFKLDDISNYLYFVPFVIIFAAFMQIMEQWLIRTKQFSINARATFYQSFIVNLSKVGIGYFYPVAQVLIIFTAISNGLRGLMMFLFSKKTKHFNDKEVTQETIRMKEIAKKYYDFPVYRAPQDLLDSFQQSFPVVLLTMFFGPAATGFYTIGRTVLRLPSNLIGKAVGDVFYPRIAEAANNNEDMAKLIKKGTYALAAVGLIPYGLIMLFGPYLFSFVFGSEWETAGEYARWIAIWSYFGLMNRPSIRSLPVLNAQRFHLFFTLTITVLKLLLIVLAYYFFKSDIVAIALFCLAGVISNVILIYVSIGLSKKRMVK